MKRFLVTLYLCSCLFVAFAQTDKIEQLESERNELHQQMEESEKLLSSTKKDVKSQLASLSLIDGQIKKRKSYIEVLQQDMSALNKESILLRQQFNILRDELQVAKEKYTASIQYMYNNRTIHEKLMFVFSANNLSQIYRRLRYVQEYADFQRLQAVELERKREQVAAKQQELDNTLKAKQVLLAEHEEHCAKLESQEEQRKKVLKNLQRKQRGIQNELSKQRKAANRLSARIDKLIEETIVKVNSQNPQQETAGTDSEKKEADANARGNVRKGKKMTTFRMSNSDLKLSGSFESNRRKLPIPITGPYVIVTHYGQYNVSGLRNVRLDSKGIDIQGKAGSKARAIFNGEVSAIFQLNGMNNVLVRHGKYISVYCNLSSVSVRKGSRVNTGDALGAIKADTSGNYILHFQLRKETSQLNPEVWLSR
ncbi:MAG: peptidoglycan DD-metalloendopeptidase family protein [Bacteroidales bacterium]|nr:peptidoglycan DD-metalloendopeptidase family protein [Bacteroidales bacterium]